MATYSDARARFDALVQRARERGMLRDEIPFGDNVSISIARYWLGQLAIYDVGPPGTPNYRLIWIITSATSSGPIKIPEPLDLTDDSLEFAFEKMLRTAGEERAG